MLDPQHKLGVESLKKTEGGFLTNTMGVGSQRN